MPVLNEKIVDIITSGQHQKDDFNSNKFSNELINSVKIIGANDIALDLGEDDIPEKEDEIQDEIQDENLSKRITKSLPERIPAFGLLMAILSIICFSFGSLTVKLIKDIHSIEILCFR